MKPNKSVEERLEQFWYLVNEWKNAPTPEDLATSARNLELFITSHTNTVLQGVVDKFANQPENWDSWSIERQIGYNIAIVSVTSFLNDQIISNEK